MLIYFGSTVTFTAEGQTWRTEKCEHCGNQFYYPVRFIATGSAINPYFLDPTSSERAEENAIDSLESALRNDIFPVPCPHCTLYQDYMLETVQDTLFSRKWTIDRIYRMLAPGLVFLGCLIPGLFERQTGQAMPREVVIAITFGLPALALIIGIGLWGMKLRRKAKYQPNAQEHLETRRHVALAHTLKPEEFAKLNIPVPAPDTAPKKLGQLVNKNCVRCNGRISNELDSRFCGRCCSPVHNRCAEPTENGCPECGFDKRMHFKP